LALATFCIIRESQVDMLNTLAAVLVWFDEGLCYCQVMGRTWHCSSSWPSEHPSSHNNWFHIVIRALCKRLHKCIPTINIVSSSQPYYERFGLIIFYFSMQMMKQKRFITWHT